MHPRFLATVLTGILGSALVACSNPTVTTPTRTLDRPSDVAMYCVDMEVPNCLPGGSPDLDPEAYLAAYCDQGTIDYANNNMPNVTVMTLDACDQDHRSQRNNDYLAKVYRAARLTGRDPGYPCCPADNPACGEATPLCARRMLGALIANTSRGELAVADTESQAPGLPTRGRLENLHGGQPGFGFLPTGLLPEHVRSFTPANDKDVEGHRYAWAVTANAGSCDLSVVDVRQIVKLAKRPNYCFLQGNWCENSTCDEQSCPQRVEPWLPGAAGAHRPLRARPSWLEIAPWSQSSAAKRRTAIVSYPTCGLIATVDLGCQDAAAPDAQNAMTCDHTIALGRVLDAVGFDAMGKPRILSKAELESLDCAADCGSDTGGGLMPDPNTLPDGGAPRVATYPATLAVEAASQRLVIGDTIGDSLTIIDFDSSASDGSRFRGTPRSIRLDFDVLPESLRGGQKGLQSIRISPRTPAGQFAYVVANDSSVRVIDLDRELECETNPEPRYLQAHAGDTTRVLPDELNASNQRRLSCFPVGSGPSKTPRTPISVGPGILLPNGSLPRDVGFVHVDVPPCDVTDGVNCSFAANAISDIWVQARTALWVGDFAWLAGGGGMLTAVQLSDACPAPSYRACFPDSAALRRIFFLHTKSQALPSPETQNLPSFNQALMVSPNDRLTNVRRVYSRFEEPGAFGPLVQADTSGLPIFATQVNGVAINYAEIVGDTEIPLGRPRLTLPAPAPYYYLPVDPVCDVAIDDQATTRTSPDGIILPEPTRRPVALVNFVHTQAIPDTSWVMAWEGALAGLSRITGKLLADGTLTDLNGLYCSRGVENGDKLRLAGCQTDADCLIGSTCQREPTQGVTPGICLTNTQRESCRDISQRLLVRTPDDPAWLATWRRNYRIVRAEQQVPLAAGDVTDRLTLDEIPEPEFEVERESCTTLGQKCTGNIYLAGRGSTTAPDYSCQVTDYADWKTRTNPQLSCILRCQSGADCGTGFVCAKSRYDGVPRCMRAPLLDAATLRTCFPDPIHYEVRGGDSFVVRGNSSGAPVLVQRDTDGSCKRPEPKNEYAVSRLLEPRLHLGPRDLADNAPQRCSRDLKDWILHRVPLSGEAIATPSCRGVRDAGQVQFPLLDSVVKVVGGSKYDIQLASDDSDPWLKREYELMSSLKLDSQTNQCILTDQREETYPSAKTAASCKYTCAQKDDPICPPGVCTKAGDTCGSVGLCRFPGDHTEALGVRRIHYETPFGNLVMRVPRVLLEVGNANSAIWSVPPDDYTVSFTITTSVRAYEMAAQTAAQDISSGVLAQGLRSITAAPSGALFVVDEGRTGVLTSLRGQVLRVVGGQVDLAFLLR